MATITPLPPKSPPPDAPELVAVNWGDEIIREIWSFLVDRELKLNLVRTHLDFCEPEQIVAAANKTGLVRYWRQRCMDALSARYPSRPRRFPAA